MKKHTQFTKDFNVQLMEAEIVQCFMKTAKWGSPVYPEVNNAIIFYGVFLCNLGCSVTFVKIMYFNVTF